MTGLAKAIVVALAAWLAVLPHAATALSPEELLSDPALEERARDISQGLRCMVCRNESIDESNAPLARDMRLLVRERLVAGDTDAEVVDFVVDRYGEYALLNPRADGANLVLWLAGPAVFLLACGIGVGYVRQRRRAMDAPPEALDADEARRLREILGE